MTQSPRTFVLVHGGRQGGWAWKAVAPKLRAAGHHVYTPTLTGVGDRSHLLRPDIGLYDHVTDIRMLLEFEDLRDVVMVGHSYAGMVITELAEVASDRIDLLVYFDALLPRPGECAYDLMHKHITDELKAAVAREGEGWQVPARIGNGVFGLSDPDLVAWARARLTAQPALTYEQPVRSDAAASRLKRSYIRCTAPAVIPDHVVARARDSHDWHYMEIAACHLAALEAPDKTVAALLACLR